MHFKHQSRINGVSTEEWPVTGHCEVIVESIACRWQTFGGGVGSAWRVTMESQKRERLASKQVKAIAINGVRVCIPALEGSSLAGHRANLPYGPIRYQRQVIMGD